MNGSEPSANAVPNVGTPEGGIVPVASIVVGAGEDAGAAEVVAAAESPEADEHAAVASSMTMPSAAIQRPRTVGRWSWRLR